jgi:uncharacterized protein (TIGR02452 family)
MKSKVTPGNLRELIVHPVLCKSAVDTIHSTTATIYSDFVLFLVSFISFIVFLQVVMIFGNHQPQPQQHRRRLQKPTAPAGRPPDPRRQRPLQIAEGTVDALRKGFYDEPVPHSNLLIRHDISADLRRTEHHTAFYPDDSIELCRWRTVPPSQQHPRQKAKLSLLPCTTLSGARHLESLTPPSSPKPLMGILNFASATRPGGGFLLGAVAQEESITRSSSLYTSLSTPIANQFYASHTQDNRGGYYTHAMIYSPNVLLFRNDNGDWLNPMKVEVVTSPAVNAKEVRGRHRAGNQSQSGGHFDRNRLEAYIRDVMRERMARVLALFEIRRVRNIVLGSFGTGVFRNDVKTVAGIWSELLNGRQARFSTSFDNVLFAIPDEKTLEEFKDGFGPLL